MYIHGSGIRARWKRWFLAVTGSRTGHPLQGEVHGGMILAVFTCRGRPAALSRATLRRYGSLWDGFSLGGYFPPGCSPPAWPALLSVIDGLCVTPFAASLAVRLLLGFGTCPGNSRAASPAHRKLPARAPGVLASPQWSAAPTDILKWVALAASYLMRQWTESPVFVDGRRCLEIDAANHILSLNRVAWRNRQDLPSHIKNSPPVYDLAEEAQWVAATFR